MFEIAHPQQDEKKALFCEFYGLSDKDLGLYALVDNTIAGAIWSRRLKPNEAPTLSVAVLAEFRGSGVGSFMMEQFLQEAATLYDEIKIDISCKPKARAFYEKFGFIQTPQEHLWVKKLQIKEIVRPSDGYDPSRWMD
jgi:GNAT superfamily N-acetyltransferase